MHMSLSSVDPDHISIFQKSRSSSLERCFLIFSVLYRHGSHSVTVLIETLPAAFHMEEILFELRNHSSGLNCGRWDYIFSFIKKRRADRSAVLPDRKDVTMTVPFMDAYVRLLIQTCHKRKVAAMGGMSAQIPIKDDPKVQ